MLKNFKIKYQQRGVKLKYSIDKKAILHEDYFLLLYPTKSNYEKDFSPILNNISELNYFDESVFNNVNRLEVGH